MPSADKAKDTIAIEAKIKYQPEVVKLEKNADPKIKNSWKGIGTHVLLIELLQFTCHPKTEKLSSITSRKPAALLLPSVAGSSLQSTVGRILSMAVPNSPAGFEKSTAIRLKAVALACQIMLIASAFNLSAVRAETAFPDLQLLTEEWKPHHYVEDGVIKGRTVDLLVSILQRVGSKQGREDIVFLPWARAYRQAQLEPNTVLFSTSRTPEREKLFKWAGPILKFDSYFIGKKERNYKVQKSEDLHQYKVGVVIDSASAIFAKRHGIPEENTTFNTQGILNIKMLAAGRIDFIPIQWANFERLALQAGIDPSEYEPVFLAASVHLNFAFSLKTPDLVVERFQAAFNEILELQEQEDGSNKSTQEVN